MNFTLSAKTYSIILEHQGSFFKNADIRLVLLKIHKNTTIRLKHKDRPITFLNPIISRSLFNPNLRSHHFAPRFYLLVFPTHFILKNELKQKQISCQNPHTLLKCIASQCCAWRVG